MSVFNLTIAGEAWLFDMSGSVSKGQTRLGTWKTADDNNIIVDKAAGGQENVPVIWSFERNCLTLTHTGDDAVNFPKKYSKLGFNVDATGLLSAKLEKGFTIALKGMWSVATTGILSYQFTGNALVSILAKGVLTDSNGSGKFLYRFGTPEHVTHFISFPGTWGMETIQVAGRDAFQITFTFPFDLASGLRKVNLPLDIGLVGDPGSFSNRLVLMKDGGAWQVEFVGALVLEGGQVVSFDIQGDPASGIASSSLRFQTPLSGAAGKNSLSFEITTARGVKKQLTFAAIINARFNDMSLEVSVRGGNGQAPAILLSGSYVADNGKSQLTLTVAATGSEITIGFDAGLEFANGGSVHTQAQVRTRNGKLVGVGLLFSTRFYI